MTSSDAICGVSEQLLRIQQIKREPKFNPIKYNLMVDGTLNAFLFSHDSFILFNNDYSLFFYKLGHGWSVTGCLAMSVKKNI